MVYQQVGLVKNRGHVHMLSDYNLKFWNGHDGAGGLGNLKNIKKTLINTIVKIPEGIFYKRKNHNQKFTRGSASKFKILTSWITSFINF